MMKKQEFVPRKISEKPLYELKSVEDIPCQAFLKMS